MPQEPEEPAARWRTPFEVKLDDGNVESFASLEEALLFRASLHPQCPSVGGLTRDDVFRVALRLPPDAELPTRESLAPTREDKARLQLARRRAQRNGLAFRATEPISLPPEFIETCWRVGRSLGIEDQEIAKRIERIGIRPVLKKVFSGGRLPDFDPESDPRAEQWLEDSLKAIYRRHKELLAMVERYNALTEPYRVKGPPLIAPPKKRREARAERKHVPIERKREWCALHFVFGWKVGEDLAEIEARAEDRRIRGRGRAQPAKAPRIVRDWNPDQHARQTVDHALWEYGSDLGLVGFKFDFREKKARKPKAPATSLS